MVIIEWLLSGKRFKEIVSKERARHRRLELEGFGAVIYWSARI